MNREIDKMLSADWINPLRSVARINPTQQPNSPFETPHA